MAIKRVSTTDDGVNLELTAAEFELIGRALYTAFDRARRVGASADEADLGRLIHDLIGTPSVDVTRAPAPAPPTTGEGTER